MNSILAATPPPPRPFYNQFTISPSRTMSSYVAPSNGRKRKAEDDNMSGDPDTRMSASPSHSPVAAKPVRTTKRSRPNISGRPLSVPRLLETLDNNALRSVLESLCDRHPELTAEVMHTAPRPSVASALEVLQKYLSTLRSSFPLGGNPASDYAYNRVRQHIANLLDALNDFTPHFLPPHELQPTTSLNYLDGATAILHRLPRWDTPQHNIDKDTAYEELSKAWVLVIREAARRGGGIQLQYGEWDQKIMRHNHTSGGKLQDAVMELNAGLGWMGGDGSSVREQLFNGTYASGLPLKVGPW